MVPWRSGHDLHLKTAAPVGLYDLPLLPGMAVTQAVATSEFGASAGPIALRLSFRGIVSRANGMPLFVLTARNVGGMTLATRYGSDQLECAISRGENYESGHLASATRQPRWFRYHRATNNPARAVQREKHATVRNEKHATSWNEAHGTRVALTCDAAIEPADRRS